MATHSSIKGFPVSSAGKESICRQCRRHWFNYSVGKIYCRKNKLPTQFRGIPGDSDGKESACYSGDLGLIPWLGRPPGGGHGNPLQYSCLENLHGQRSLAGYRPWGCKESDTTGSQGTAQWQCVDLRQLSLETDASLWWRPWESKIMSGIYTELGSEHSRSINRLIN